MCEEDHAPCSHHEDFLQIAAMISSCLEEAEVDAPVLFVQCTPMGMNALMLHNAFGSMLFAHDHFSQKEILASFRRFYQPQALRHNRHPQSLRGLFFWLGIPNGSDTIANQLEWADQYLAFHCYPAAMLGDSDDAIDLFKAVNIHYGRGYLCPMDVLPQSRSTRDIPWLFYDHGQKQLVGIEDEHAFDLPADAPKWLGEVVDRLRRPKPEPRSTRHPSLWDNNFQ
jgi:hypothetical protein